MRPFYLALFLFVSLTTQAQYRINLQINTKQDSIAYLRGVVFDDKNYFPKDTIRIAKKNIVLQSTKPIVGGIYYFQLDKSKKRHYFILENNDKLSLTISGNEIQSTNPRNQVFFQYQKLEKSFRVIDSLYAVEIARGRKFSYSDKAAFFKDKTSALKAFRTKALPKLNPSEVLHIYFSALNRLDGSVPDKKNYAARAQFIKGLDFNTNKLLFIPNYKELLTEYMGYYPTQADSLLKGIDIILKKVNCQSKSYPYVFDYFAQIMRNRNVQNNTEGFVKFVNTYVEKGNCPFPQSAQKSAFIDEAKRLQATLSVAKSPTISLPDTAGVKQDLHAFARLNDYTLLAFYAPTCDHCQKEVPEMDSTMKFIESRLNLSLGRFYVCNEPGVPKATWRNFISDYKITSNAVHVELPNISDIRTQYDAFTNPVFFLLNREGEIVARRISPTTLRKFFAEIQRQRINTKP
jgi:thiol-disulfide isomerase/thioredoxin